MKKLLLIAFTLIATTVFCAEKTTKAENVNGNTTQMTESNPVMTTEVGLGESFMTAFGMGGNTSTGGTSEGGSGSSSTGTTSAGTTSSALSTSTTVSNTSVTIGTPYNK